MEPEPFWGDDVHRDNKGRETRDREGPDGQMKLSHVPSHTCVSLHNQRHEQYVRREN